MNRAWTWFHLSPFAWNVKFVNGNFLYLLWFWMENLSISALFQVNLLKIRELGGEREFTAKKLWFLEILELDATPIFITIVLITTQKGDHSIENHKSIGQYDLLTLVYNYFSSTTGVITAMFEKCSPKQLLLKNLSASVFLKRKNEFLLDFVACF